MFFIQTSGAFINLTIFPIQREQQDLPKSRLLFNALWSPHSAKAVAPSRRSPSDVTKCFSNESDVKSACRNPVGGVWDSNSDLTARSEVQSAAGACRGEKELDFTGSSDFACCSLSCMPVIAPSWPCKSNTGIAVCSNHYSYHCAAILWSNLFLDLSMTSSLFFFPFFFLDSSGLLRLSLFLWLW